MLQRDALHALDVARLGCLSRFWRARAGAELRSMAAEYARALPSRPDGALLYLRVQGQPCSACGVSGTCMAVHPVTREPLCSRHGEGLKHTGPPTRALAGLHVDALSARLIPLRPACKGLMLTQEDGLKLPIFAVGG
jgi:hypothetical protein